MGILDGLLKFIGATGNQLVSSMNFWQYEADKREIKFSDNCIQQLRDQGLGENDALDVYYHGFSDGETAMEKKYNGYSIRILYSIHPRTGKIQINWVKKRDRR